MAERPRLKGKILSALTGIGLPLIAGAALLFESISIDNYPPSVELKTRVRYSLKFYREGVIRIDTIPCSSIPIIQRNEIVGHLSGGDAIRNTLLIDLNSSLEAYAQTDLSACYRPWVLDRQKVQAVQ